MEDSNQEESLLLLEGTLTNTMLLEGLDCLRSANIYVKGLYYQAFFSLSIGIERLLKLIIVEEYRGKNKKVPDNSYLTKLGHDIYEMVKLYAPSLLKDEINEKVITFFSNFAKTTRYYNLDVLTGKESKFLNPLEEWKEIENLIISKYSIKYKKVENKEVLAKTLDEFADIRFQGMNLREINSGLQIVEEAEERDVRQGAGVLVCFRIIQELTNKLNLIEMEYCLYPYLWEIFRKIRGSYTNIEIRRKKDWISLIQG